MWVGYDLVCSGDTDSTSYFQTHEDDSAGNSHAAATHCRAHFTPYTHPEAAGDDANCGRDTGIEPNFDAYSCSDERTQPAIGCGCIPNTHRVTSGARRRGGA